MPNALQSSSHLSGLSGAEAKARLTRDGANELPQPNRRTPFRIVVEVIREPMLALLIGAGVVYLALGDVKDASVLLVFACLFVFSGVTSVDAMAATGPRVLGVARALFSGTELPASQQDFAFDFIGRVGLADPLRQSVPAAVRECQTAGIRVVMITGDYPATAREIACQAGLAGSDVVTGDELETLSDEQLAARVRTTTVFARIMPEQKLRIVEALKPPRSRYLRQPAQGDVLYFSGAGAHRWTSASAACVRSTDSVRTDPHRIPPNGNRPRLLARIRG